MHASSQSVNGFIAETHLKRPTPRAEERGVVLVIALILLVIISLLAVTTMRNTGSTESVSGNVRTSALAFQSAELALRYCERSVSGIVSSMATVAAGGSPTYTATAPEFTATNILPTSTTPQWQGTTVWDSTSTSTYILGLTATVNQTGLTATYQRPPECMVVTQPVMVGPGAISTTASFIVTARGFGPEVAAADSARSRPVGSVVWLQSTMGF